MHITITKGSDRDWLTVERPDGSRISSTFPKKGMIPHDAVHFFAEQGMGFGRGFWGLVAEGGAIDDIADLAKAGGHASAKRAAKPDPAIVELLQAERLVECLEAAQWSGSHDPELIRSAWQAGCDQSEVPMPDADDAVLAAILADIGAFSNSWLSLNTGEKAELTWQGD